MSLVLFSAYEISLMDDMKLGSSREASKELKKGINQVKKALISNKSLLFSSKYVAVAPHDQQESL